MKLSKITVKQWLIVGIVILIIAIIWLSVRNKNKVTTTTTTTTPVKPGGGTTTPKEVFPLKLGSRNKEVGIVQTFLNGKGEKLAVDNIWGPLTNAAALRVLGTDVIDSDYFYNNIFPFY